MRKSDHNMSPVKFRAAAEALFGPKWEKPLALRLGVTPLTVRCWASGKRPIIEPIARLIIAEARHSASVRHLGKPSSWFLNAAEIAAVRRIKNAAQARAGMRKRVSVKEEAKLEETTE